MEPDNCPIIKPAIPDYESEEVVEPEVQAGVDPAEVEEGVEEGVLGDEVEELVEEELGPDAVQRPVRARKPSERITKKKLAKNWPGEGSSADLPVEI